MRLGHQIIQLDFVGFKVMVNLRNFQNFSRIERDYRFSGHEKFSRDYLSASLYKRHVSTNKAHLSRVNPIEAFNTVELYSC